MKVYNVLKITSSMTWESMYILDEGKELIKKYEELFYKCLAGDVLYKFVEEAISDDRVIALLDCFGYVEEVNHINGLDNVAMLINDDGEGYLVNKNYTKREERY